jgi:hypothetical protein
MAPPKSRGGKKAGGAARGQARNDADEALEDAIAELEDTAAALNAPAALAAAPSSESPQLPDGLLQRRLDKEKLEKKQAILEKELMQKQIEDMRAELELAKATVGNVVQVDVNPSATPARKVPLA